MATNYDINYNDNRFTQVESQKNAALSEIEKVYSGMANSSDAYYQKQIEASQEWANRQSELQQQKTDFAIQQIEQEKAQAEQDYIKEQSGAYVDWQKQSNKYGTIAEQQASNGLQNTGYSESSQVSMYNTYQNRVATARESFNRAILNYNNAIHEARLQNNSILAEIAYNALQEQLELSLQGFQYKNQLIIEQSNKMLEVENSYYSRYLDVLDQINTENALAEKVRQYDTSLAEEQRQYNASLAEEIRQFNAKQEEEIVQAQASNTGYTITSKTPSKQGTTGLVDSTGSNSKTINVAYSDPESEKGNAASNAAKSHASILALGEGPMSGEKLMSLVESGEVVEYIDETGAQIFARTKTNLPTLGINNVLR